MSQRFAETERTIVVNCATAGDNIIIPAPSAIQALYIDNVNFITSAAVTVTLKSGVTALSGPYAMTANQGYAMENTPALEHGILECEPGQAFVINLGGAVQVSGFVRYRILNEGQT